MEQKKTEIKNWQIADAMKKDKEKEEQGTENEPSCSAENNDNIEFVHNAEGGKE